MDTDQKPYIGSGHFCLDFVAGRPTAGTIYVFISYREYPLTGIYKSTDYGETWDLFMNLDDITGGDSDFENFEINESGNYHVHIAASDDYVFLAVMNGWTHAGIWRMPHSGASTTKIHTGNGSFLKISARIDADANGYVVQGMYAPSNFFDGVMAWSNDNGTSWTELKHLSDNTLNPERVKWIRVSGSTVYVMYNTASYTTLWYTTDAHNGLACTWTRVEWGLGDPAGRTYGRFDMRFSTLRISAQLVTGDKVVLSDDVASADAYITDLITAAGDPDNDSNYPRGYHPTDSVCLVVTMNGKVWEIDGSHPPTAATHIGTLPGGPRLPGAWPKWDDKDSSVVYVCGEYTGIYRSTDDGVTWLMKGALPTNYNGDPKYKMRDAFTDVDGTAIAAHDPDYCYGGGGWSAPAGAVEIQGNKAVESVPGAGSIAVVNCNVTCVPDARLVIADIIPSSPFDVSIYESWEDATHYLRLHLYESGGNLTSDYYYNNGAGEVHQSGPFTIATMPTDKFRVLITYADVYTDDWHMFTCKLDIGSDYQKAGDALKNGLLDTVNYLGFGWGATDGGSEIDGFYMLQAWHRISDQWFSTETDESIDGKVLGDHYPSNPPGACSQVPDAQWSVESGSITKITGDSYSGVASLGGGTDGLAMVESDMADLFVDGFYFDPWSSADQFACLIFRGQDASNYLMLGAESVHFAVWKVIGGVLTELGTEGHSFSSSGTAYMIALILGRHICVVGVKTGNASEVVFDDDEDTFKEKTLIGIYSGPDVVRTSNEIIGTGGIRSMSLPRFAGGSRNQALVIS